MTSVAPAAQAPTAPAASTTRRSRGAGRQPPRESGHECRDRDRRDVTERGVERKHEREEEGTGDERLDRLAPAEALLEKRIRPRLEQRHAHDRHRQPAGQRRRAGGRRTAAQDRERRRAAAGGPGRGSRSPPPPAGSTAGWWSRRRTRPRRPRRSTMGGTGPPPAATPAGRSRGTACRSRCCSAGRRSRTPNRRPA